VALHGRRVFGLLQAGSALFFGKLPEMKLLVEINLRRGAFGDAHTTRIEY